MSSFKTVFTFIFAINVIAIGFVSMEAYLSSSETRILTVREEYNPQPETSTFLRGEPKIESDYFITEPSSDFKADQIPFTSEPEPEPEVEAEPVLLTEPEFAEESKNISHKFEDQSLAVHLLQFLDVHEKPANLTEMEEHAYFTYYTKYHYGLTSDDQYCQKHREHFVSNPEIIFDEFNVYCDFSNKSVLRKSVIPKMGNDSMPHIGPHMDNDEKGKWVYDINTNISIFYTDYLYWSREIGKQFSCLTQSSNHIPGHVVIYRKDFASEAINEYKKSYISRPQCLKTNKFFPESWLLTNKQQCGNFFELINNPEYEELKRERGVVYIRKIAAGSHAAAGVAVVNQTEEDDLRQTYDNGRLCGNIHKNYLIQKMIHNPLLLNGHKFDFRVFMLIASTNPAIVYTYRDAFVWASTEKYGTNVAEKGGFIPNASFNNSVVLTAWSNGTYNGMTFKELQDFATQTLEELEGRLLKSGQITDSDWLNNYLRPEIKKAIAHIIRMGQYPFLKSSSVYEIMGVDFMLDEHLDLWFIEANIYPSFVEYSDKETKILNGMLTDQFEIVSGLVKSRAKRIINYINFLTKEGKAWRDENGASFDDYELRKMEFKEISKNYFEPEFEPKSTNNFQLVVNDNFKDERRYAGLIPQECF